MRIIAGARRGMKLFSPETDVSRPITDRVKESLFDVLWNYGFPEGKIVADLFSGVGSLGLESLSRGAEFVAFVEKDPKILATLKKNIEKAGFEGESKVVKANAFSIGAPANVRKYDLVFVDPPYAASRDTKEDSPLVKLLALLAEQLSLNGIVVVRTEKRIELLERYGSLKVIERRQWGTMVVTMLQRSSE
jgi:16S rRNA (guanine966-N2)-methyltransferase